MEMNVGVVLSHRGVGATTLEVTELTDAAPLGVEWAMEIPP